MIMEHREKVARLFGFVPHVAAAQFSNPEAAETVNRVMLCIRCCTVPNLVGKLLLIAMSVAQLPVENCEEDH